MVLLKKALLVFKVFITKVLYVFNQVLLLELYIGVYLSNKIKLKINFSKIILFGSLKNLIKFEYFLHFLCEHDEVMSQ